MLREPPLDNAADNAGGDPAPSLNEVLRAALAPLAAQIDAAFIYGPAAQKNAQPGQREGVIDLMIIGSGIAHADVIPLLIAATKFLGRAIQPSVYGADELARKVAAGNRVALALTKQRKIFLIGSEDCIPQPR